MGASESVVGVGSTSSPADSYRFNPGDWPHFQHLDPKLVDEIKLFYVFGDCGSNVIFVTNDDDVYCFSLSNDNDNRWFCSTEEPFGPKHLKTLSKKKVVKFEYGSGGHLLALTASGVAYGWGNNTSRQLVAKGSEIEEPMKINLCDKVIFDIACGTVSSLFLTDNRRGVYYSETEGTTIQSLGEEIVSMACGPETSHIVAQDGSVYSFCSTLTFVRSKQFADINAVQIVAGGKYFFLLLTSDGNMYIWAQVGHLSSDEDGQLAPDEMDPVHILSDIGKVSGIAAVHYKELFVAITREGCVYVWKALDSMNRTLTPFKSLEAAFAFYSQPSITFQSISVPAKKKSTTTVLTSLRNAFNDNSTSNLKFRFKKDGGKTISVHRDILKIRCEYFRKMFDNQWKESSRDVIDIENCSYTVYNAFLNYLYTDQVQGLSTAELLSLLDLATSSCETGLVDLCVSLIKETVDVDNAAAVYADAVKFESAELKELCVSFAHKHQTSVFESKAYANLDKDIVIQFAVEISKKAPRR